MMESSRENFEKIVKKYDEYVDLYLFFNNGSREGLCSFAEFYWRFTYHVKYEEAILVGIANM